MSPIRMLLAGALCAVASMQAASSEAALVTRSYEGSADFGAAFAGLVTFAVTLTFDTDTETIDAAVDAYSSSSGLASFNPASVVFTRRKLAPADLFYNIAVGGSAFGAEAAGVNDFFFKFADLPNSPVVSIYYDGVFVPGTGSAVIVSTSTPVPEPATWGMMLIGFGALGGAMRSARSRKRTALPA